jgi:hypothetical protein
LGTARPVTLELNAKVSAFAVSYRCQAMPPCQALRAAQSHL